jgi:hypothetical protein
MPGKYAKPFNPDVLLRDVYLGDTGYRLTVWESEKRQPRNGHPFLGYIFRDPSGMVLFSGEDYGPSPMDAQDSDASLRGLVTFLTIRPGDTDDEYFAKYDRTQMAWVNGPDIERLNLQSWGSDEPEDVEYAPFVEVRP